MTYEEIIAWLLTGDVSIQYQTQRDLLNRDLPGLQKRISTEGWGARFLSLRQADGYWSKGFYLPKWTSTHYTLLDLKNLNLPANNKLVRETLKRIFETEWGPDGGITPNGKWKHSDVCVNGMVLNYACYFGVKEKYLEPVIDFLLGEKMGDGGFNCKSNTKGAVHSSLHTTLSVLEGIYEYMKRGYTYRLGELMNAKVESQEFILMHRLFRSDKTGKIIHPGFLNLCYPGRWHYDILKSLDYFRLAGVKYDRRMDDAIQVLLDKKTVQGIWELAAPYPGHFHFQMEKAGNASRWNTLRAMRVLGQYK